MTPLIAQWVHDWWRSTQPCLSSSIGDEDHVTEAKRQFLKATAHERLEDWKAMKGKP